ncbi:type III-B CRISPR module RAMP protein Cmr4 [Paenibacillus faecalis]|uniref:type III-B CRISPR module RAMP protein Cmr4 n=1 Tax=Paenibacillus faecalis TaxID=2079532 RepID=UPI000D10BAF0|nr:type III-B CRISPR module RAMP protein Cmr4 [Paenibacillus faecalis]
MSNSKLYYLHCLSPVHIGTGQGVGVVDMPIMRERITQWPLIPGSSMKGVQREHFRRLKQPDAWLDAAFGKSGDDGNAGAFVLTDSRLLAFPVASRYGTFAYVTCPLALKRLYRDAKSTGVYLPDLDLNALESKLGIQSRKQQGESALVTEDSKIDHEQMIHIDEFRCAAIEDQAFHEWATWMSEELFSDPLSRDMFMERIMLVSDDAFQHFVTMCCEIVPRIRIDKENKTVESGALWTEEYLPVESILYGIVWCDKIHGSSQSITVQQLLGVLSEEMILQVGGNTTVGKGRIRCRFSKEASV